LKELENDKSINFSSSYNQFENKKSTYDFKNYTSTFDPN